MLSMYTDTASIRWYYLLGGHLLHLILEPSILRALQSMRLARTSSNISQFILEIRTRVTWMPSCRHTHSPVALKIYRIQIQPRCYQHQFSGYGRSRMKTDTESQHHCKPSTRVNRYGCKCVSLCLPRNCGVKNYLATEDTP